MISSCSSVRSFAVKCFWRCRSPPGRAHADVSAERARQVPRTRKPNLCCNFRDRPAAQVQHRLRAPQPLLQPRPEQERTATIVISALLMGTIVIVLGLAVLILHQIFL
jgi:hypothetical protein